MAATTPVQKAREKKPRDKNAELILCTEMAGYWLHLGNVASEKGKLDLAERHYDRSQKWHYKMNQLLGNS